MSLNWARKLRVVQDLDKRFPQVAVRGRLPGVRRSVAALDLWALLWDRTRVDILLIFLMFVSVVIVHFIYNSESLFGPYNF